MSATVYDAREALLQKQLIALVRAKKAKALMIVQKHVSLALLKTGVMPSPFSWLGLDHGASASRKARLVRELAELYEVPEGEASPLWELVPQHHEKIRQLTSYHSVHSTRGPLVGVIAPQARILLELNQLGAAAISCFERVAQDIIRAKPAS